MTFSAAGLVLRASIICVVLACLYACERKTQPQAGISVEGTMLAASLKSKQSPDQVRAELDRAGWRDWRVIDQPKGNIPGDRPEFRFLSAEADGRSLGVEGTLRMDFLNDRLMATWFFPSDFAAYRAAIQQLPQTNPMRNASFGTDYRKRQYAVWEDLQLKKEMEDWIRKYS